MKHYESTYLPHQKLIVTHLSGDLDDTDIKNWQLALTQVFEQLPDNAQFKILVNLHGFKATDFNVHKQFRVIIPRLLANYGWYIGYLRLFPETELTIRSDRNIHCVAAAHVHHDETKITKYATYYRMHNEGFFTDPQAARNWLDSIAISD
ncbi:hypothetical protein IC229_22600 [Spirosoma sp. BT702]|uniref:STAS/SEC14 domain-containing protein n=1 Tax=Spirosoma profusum TaxID=2771354 RepID=A0A927AUB6_9BACT|nr:hypothetical protein [Spirosoma profusum]MBD2703452.1 hypothetical protein [Spirosoma profusum]